MALPINIELLIKQRIVENSRIDYKRNCNPEDIIHSICAFANDIDNWGGGYIVVGIEEINGMPKFPISGIATCTGDPKKGQSSFKLLPYGQVIYQSIFDEKFFQ